MDTVNRFMSLRTLESDMRTNSTKIGRITWNCASTWQGQSSSFLCDAGKQLCSPQLSVLSTLLPRKVQETKGNSEKKNKKD